VARVKWIPLHELQKMIAAREFPGRIDKRVVDFIEREN
jgi:hypothetical protein